MPSGRHDGVPNEERIAEDIAADADADARHALVTGGLREQRPLIDEAAGPLTCIDFLKATISARRPRMTSATRSGLNRRSAPTHP